MKTNTVEEYQEKAKAMLDAWSADMSRLRASAFLLEAEARAEAVRRLAELEYLYGEAFQQYVVMHVDTNGRLEDLKRSFELAAEAVCSAIDLMSSEVREVA